MYNVFLFLNSNGEYFDMKTFPILFTEKVKWKDNLITLLPFVSQEMSQKIMIFPFNGFYVCLDT